jgi:hypothetical protein
MMAASGGMILVGDLEIAAPWSPRDGDHQIPFHARQSSARALPAISLSEWAHPSVAKS